MKRGLLLGFSFAVFLLALFAATGQSQAADDENCLMCHKYIKMGRITQEGERKYYYVDESTFRTTVHNRVRCRDCHSYIDRLPHAPVTTGVTCNSTCHSIKNPATRKDFNHKNIYDVYMKSVHGRDKRATNELDKDKPYCVFCHTNPIYIPEEKEPPAVITDRCQVCHQERNFVNHRYYHTARRIKGIRRSSEEIVKLCSICHANEEMLDRHNELAEEENHHLGKKFTYAAEAYLESFHWKVTKFGYKGAPNCLTCHAEEQDYYMAVHDIQPSRNPDSITNRKNRIAKICSRCHKDANQNFARIDPHPTERVDDNPFIYYVEAVYGPVGNIVTLSLLGLMIFETIGRKRDGVLWVLKKGSTWRGKSPRGRDRRQG